MEKHIKCKIKLSKQLFPKNKVHNGEYAILSVKIVEVLEGEPTISSWGTITIVGNVCEIDENEIYTIIAKETMNEKYGLQYELIYIGSQIKINSVQDQKIFLSKILTENQVDNLFETFKKPLDIIKQGDVKQLCKVKGIGVKSALSIIEKYNQSKDYSQAYIALNDYGLTSKMIQKLVDSYGSPDTLVNKIKENPYLIADDVEGIGWARADNIALNSGYGQYSKNRIKAYIEYLLKQKALEGNSYLDIDEVLDCLESVIGYDIPEETLNVAFQELSKNKMWFNEDKTFIGLKKFYELELNISKELLRLKNSENKFKYNDWENKIKIQEQLQGWEYTDEQANAIELILNNNVILLGGSAGTGKTSTVAGVLSALKGYHFAQTALSGKASVNLTEVTGEEGYTIHRLLGYNPVTGFTFNKDNKLSYDIIILDELSMVDGMLFYKLIQSIKDGAKLIMLGDTGQLESIGVANIMQDIIDSKVIPHAMLTKIHRQAAKSAIITESMKIRNAEHITTTDSNSVEIRGELQDLLLDVYNDKTYTFDKIISYTKEVLKKIDDIMDFQVLVPMKNSGGACTYKINLAIQELLNHKKGLRKKKNNIEIASQSKTPYNIYEGDKIINVKNNYKTINKNGDTVPIFNGNLGIVKEIDQINGLMTIHFQGLGEILVPQNHWNFIELGYAITVHKSQGSGFKYIICGLDYSHYILLNKEMVYTMLTRAKKYCYLCAENKALRYAIKRSNIQTKQTFLKELLIKSNKY